MNERNTVQTFPTPGPIRLTLEVHYGDVQIVASERSDTVVDVRPTDPGDQAHIAAAESTRLELLGDELRVIEPKPSLMARILNSPSIDVLISLPTGSAVRADVAAANVAATGRLGECRIRTGAGRVRFDDTGSFDARSGAGDITVGHVAGDATLASPSGHTRVASATGNVSIRNGSTPVRIGPVGGDLYIRAGHGAIEAASVGGRVDAATAHGSVEIGCAAGPDVEVRTSHGSLEVGIPDGRAVWLDLDTRYGRVESQFLPTAEAPAETGPSVRVIGRTSYGDIRILRITEPSDGDESEA